MSGAREILILTCFGIGHYNPNMQLARACLSQLPEGSHVTMLVPVPQHSERCVARPQEDGGDFRLLKNEWTLRFLDGGKIHQWFWLYSDADGSAPLNESSENDRILKWFFENQLSWVDDVKRIFANRRTKPDVIFADIAVFYDGPIAEYYQIPSYYFFPSPLFFYNLLDHIYKFALDVQQKLSHTSAEELDIASPLVALPGFNGLKVDLLREALVQDLTKASVTQYFSEVTIMANRKRAGVVCNDVQEFNGPEAAEEARCRPDFRIFTIGPLALHYDERVLPKPDTTCNPIYRGRSDPSSREDPILAWLDEQRPGSIVFISFGSTYDLDHRDVFELAAAIGLLLDEPRADGPAGFVWAHRPTKKRDEQLYADESGLPAGWREKYADRVKVSSWVNQVALLKHEAVGLFVTHSGWNGLMEAISVGHSPLLMLPVAAEQPGNAKVMESYHQVGERLRAHPSLGGPLVCARICDQMCKCLNNTVYAANVGKLSKLCQSAWGADGSSRMALKQLLN